MKKQNQSCPRELKALAPLVGFAKWFMIATFLSSLFFYWVAYTSRSYEDYNMVIFFSIALTVFWLGSAFFIIGFNSYKDRFRRGCEWSKESDGNTHSIRGN